MAPGQSTLEWSAKEQRTYKLECLARKDLHALGSAFGYHGDGKTTSGELFARALKQEKLECMTRHKLVALAKFRAIEADQKSAVIIEKILFFVAGAAKQALPATPIKPVTDVRTVLSSSSDTPRVYASTANVVTHSGNTVVQVVVPSGLHTSISPDFPMSTSDSPELKRPCGIGGADAVLPVVDLPPNEAELAIVAELSSRITTFQLQPTEALSRLDACTSHGEVRSGFAVSALKTLRNVVSTFQSACFPKKTKKKPQAVGDTHTEGTSHQSGTPGVTSGVDAVPPAVPSFSVGGATRRRARRKRRFNVVPFVTKGPASDIKHGTIVGVNHEKKFAFIRTSRNTTDFYVGQQQYHHGMAIGDEVSFCELEPRGRRRRCPEAYHVDLLARAWTWYHGPYGARKRSTGL